MSGEDHVALGSDFDGSTKTSFEASGMGLVAQSLHAVGLSDVQIRKVMGGNALRLFAAALPDR